MGSKTILHPLSQALALPECEYKNTTRPKVVVCGANEVKRTGGQGACLHPLSQALALPECEDKDYSEICVGVTGAWQGHRNGSFSLSEADFLTIIENHKARDLDIVIDYEHQSLSKDKAPAAGWIKELYVKDKKLYAKAEWTKAAKEHIKAKEYRYLSPVFEFNAKSEKTAELVGTRLHSVAITNKPFLDELGELVINALKPEPSSCENPNNKGDESMNKELEEKIAKLEATNKELSEANKTLSEQNTALNESLAKQKVDSAIVANKLNKEQETWALKYAINDPAGFDEFIALASAKTTPPQNDLFANKAEAPQNEFDILKLAGRK